MTTSLPGLERLRTELPEFQELPDGWTVQADKDRRLFFVNPGKTQTQYSHPTWGNLPKPWILRLCSESDGKRHPRYFNLNTRKSTTENPRVSREVLKANNDSWKEDSLGTTASFSKMRKTWSLNTMKRQPIGNVNIRHKYDILKALDPGDGTVGGMNGGVFVVRLRGQERLSVEKRFKAGDVKFGKKEVEMLYRLRHGSISFYTAAFVTPDLRLASVYVEFCDRGSLESLIKAYAEHRGLNVPHHQKPEIPERFIWHAFAGLCDGLAYLLGGRSYIPQGVTDYRPAPGWIPVLHRDMKPDNVLLRSRDTLGSKKYFYCVLSDFGLACEDRPPGHPEEDKWQQVGSKLGTKQYFAPELLYSPYPKGELQFHFFPNGQKHTVKSDLYSLGASIYNMVDLPPVLFNGRPTNAALSHAKFDTKPFNVELNHFWEGTLSRKDALDISQVPLNTKYTPQLQEAILEATRWDPKGRPDAIEMVQKLKTLMTKSKFHSHMIENANEELPSWATRVHDYHSREPLDPRTFDHR